MDLGACRHCGAVIIGQYTDEMTEDEKNEMATRMCNCANAELERYKRDEKAMTKERIRELLIEKSEEIGFKNKIEDTEVHLLLDMIVDLASDGKINGINMVLEDSTRFKITEKEGKINVERVQNIKYKL
jgi:hypothetical protein